MLVVGKSVHTQWAISVTTKGENSVSFLFMETFNLEGSIQINHLSWKSESVPLCYRLPV